MDIGRDYYQVPGFTILIGTYASLLTFLWEHIASGALLIKLDDGGIMVQRGRFTGVHEGSIYSIMPLGFKRADKETLVIEERVNYVDSFKAVTKVVSRRTLANAALAFP
jgi:hypothetical protein